MACFNTADSSDHETETIRYFNSRKHFQTNANDTTLGGGVDSRLGATLDS
jgi:hypothetical protein